MKIGRVYVSALLAAALSLSGSYGTATATEPEPELIATGQASSTPTPAASAGITPGLLQVGVPLTNPTPIGNNGMDIPLASALRQIVPPTGGWTVDTEQVGGTVLISFSKGEPWTKALKTIAKQKNLAITIDWNRNRVSVSDGLMTADAVNQVSPATPTAASVKAPPITFAITAGSLKDNLDRLTHQYGWMPVWKLENDYNVLTNFSLTATDFKDGIGQLVAPYHISVEFWDLNQVAEFTNRQ